MQAVCSHFEVAGRVSIQERAAQRIRFANLQLKCREMDSALEGRKAWPRRAEMSEGAAVILLHVLIQRLAKIWALGCVNPDKRQATTQG